MLKNFNCFKDVSFRFKVRRVTGFLLLSVVWLGLIGFPSVVSAQVPVPPVVEPPVEVPVEGVDIPDAGLRAAIAQALGKAPGDTITRADMETLGELHAGFREITDLRGIESAINLRRLDLNDNTISDLSPLSSLTNLTWLNLAHNTISDTAPLMALTNLTDLFLYRNSLTDLSPLSTLTNLKQLNLGGNTISNIVPLITLTNLKILILWVNDISDLSPLSSLTNLTWLDLNENTISDLSPLASLTNLTRLDLNDNTISDLSPLASLTNLTTLRLQENDISDLSPLASLTNLTGLNLKHNSITDLLPLANLTNLTGLDLESNSITDLSPLANLTNLAWLDLSHNTLSDIFPLIALTNLIRLHLEHNTISDIETLELLMAQGTIVHFRGNPAFETPGPKIEDGWVGLIVPAMDVRNGSDAAGSGRDFLSEASGGAVSEIAVAVNGAQAGTQVGASVWTAGRLDATDPNNLNTIVAAAGLTDIRYPVAYGVASIHSETQQQTRLYIGAAPVKVWLNGTLVYRDTAHRSPGDYETAVPVLLNAGDNVLFVAAYRPNPWTSRWGAFFGFQDGTEYTLGPRGTAPEPFWMYWTGLGSIQRALNDGTNRQLLVPRRNVKDIALDVASGKMYWTAYNSGKIQRANLDGSHVEDLVTGLRALSHIAVDVASGKMYWTANAVPALDFGSKIQRANLDGSHVEDLVTGFENPPDGIALDITAGKMYWTASALPALELGSGIQRANLDGSNVETLVGTDRISPSDIALDIAAGKMYWIDGGTALIIQRANLNGSNVETLITAEIPNSRGLYPNSIALDVANGKMYCTVQGIGIQRANLDGSNVEDLFTDPSAYIRTASGIALGIPQPSGPGPGPAPGPDPLDVNGNGQVNVLDLVLVAAAYGARGTGLPADVNADGVVNIQDLIAVAAGIDASGAALPQAVKDALAAAAAEVGNLEAIAEAPSRFSTAEQAGTAKIVYRNVADALADAKHLATSDAHLEKFVPLLEELLRVLAEMREIPDTTALLPNYPNPFNPETWIPYHLSKDAEVTLTIHDVRGVLVRELALGYQSAGVYESRGRAAYWDGKNTFGESVASGVYFYTLTAGDFNATRKLLIAK